jgi:hypothetical protein
MKGHRVFSPFKEVGCSWSLVSLPQFERVPEAELYWNEIRKGRNLGQDPKSLHTRILARKRFDWQQPVESLSHR